MKEYKIIQTERGGVVVDEKFDFNDFKSKSIFYHSGVRSIFTVLKRFNTFLEAKNETYVTNFGDLNLQSYGAIITHTIYPLTLEGVPMIGEPKRLSAKEFVKHKRVGVVGWMQTSITLHPIVLIEWLEEYHTYASQTSQISEEDLRKAMLHASYETFNNKGIVSHRNIDEYTQSLHPIPTSAIFSDEGEFINFKYD